MTITYKDTREFKARDLERLFLSVEWSSGAYPDKLVEAMRGSDAVISAWDGEELIGLANIITDKCMTGYIHYVLVNPAYHGKGVGKELLKRMTALYEDYITLVLVSYDTQTAFYEKCGFDIGKTETPMFLTKIKL